MNVNFTGMQNVGSVKKRNPKDHQDRVYRMAIQLNNKGENDLDEFKKVLDKRSGFKNNDFLDIELKSTPNKRNPNKPTNDLYINSKKLELTNENLPIFSKINNLLKRIAKGEESVPVSPGYLLTEAPSRFNSELRKLNAKEQREIISELHNPEKVKEDANIMSEEIVKTLTNYCTTISKPIFSGVKSVGGFAVTTSEKRFERLHFELNDKDKALFNQYLDRDIFGTSSNVINIDMAKNLKTGESTIGINDNPIEVNNRTLPVLKKVTEFLSKMIKTEEEFPFPADYLSAESLNIMSKDAFVDGELNDYLSMSPKEKASHGLEPDVEVEIISTDKGVKRSASKILEKIEDKLIAYFD